MEDIPQLRALPSSELDAMKAVSAVFPFRVNCHVIEELIDWSAVPDDPIFRLVFPQPGMLRQERLSELLALVAREAPQEELEQAAARIQLGLNPHPAGQKPLNVPRLDGEPVPGLQHMYRETVLFFPSAGQSCHSYCTYCFRWAQFTQHQELRFESPRTDALVRYLRRHPEVTNVLITGGDPLVMSTELLRECVQPLLDPALEHVRSIRLGTKSLTYWPHRFLGDRDADALLRLFEDVVAAGRHLALMAHVSHPREIEHEVARAAMSRILGTGAVIRTQSPVIRGVNDDADVWADLWRTQVQLGAVPYYMFVARDTGAQDYFKIPLAEALQIYSGAFRRGSGLARTARGPVMSATPGKVLVDGVARVAGQDVFLLSFLQGRDPSWVGRPFFARFDPNAAWLDDLEPAFGMAEFFYEPRFREMAAMAAQKGRPGGGFVRSERGRSPQSQRAHPWGRRDRMHNIPGGGPH